jgi:tetratricopeptide (TPR) repeat protein
MTVRDTKTFALLGCLGLGLVGGAVFAWKAAEVYFYGEPAKAIALGARVESLAEELAALQQRLATAAPVAIPLPVERDAMLGTEPAPGPGVSLAVEARLAALEQAVAQLRSQQLGQPSASQPGSSAIPNDVPGLLLALADKNLRGHGVTAEQRQRRIDLLRRLLELDPGHESAAQALLDLADDHVASNPKAGIELLDQFAARVTLPPWQLAGRYANLHGFAGDRDRERAIHAATARDPRTPEAEQASAWFWHAHSFFQQQRYEEAAAGFAAILRDYGTNIDAGIQQTVAGARNHLEQAQQAMQKRVERR